MLPKVSPLESLMGGTIDNDYPNGDFVIECECCKNFYHGPIESSLCWICKDYKPIRINWKWSLIRSGIVIANLISWFVIIRLVSGLFL